MKLPGGIPIPVLVLGLPALAVAAAGLAMHSSAERGPPRARPLLSADLVVRDEPDGSIDVSAAADGRRVATLAPASNAFLRVMLAGLVRERRREGQRDPALPFHVTRWSDGRLTLDDSATGRLIELNALGPDNAAAFGRLLDLSRTTAPK